MNRSGGGIPESLDGQANKGPDTALERGILVLAVIPVSFCFLLLGPNLYREIKPELRDALDPWAPSPYARFLRKQVQQLLDHRPELVTLLQQPNWQEQAIDLTSKVMYETVFAQVSVQELEKLHKLIESAWDRMKSELASVQGDGKPPLGDELETDIETIASEPRRLSEAIPPSTLGLGARERRHLKVLGLSLGASDDPQAGEYTQTIMPTLLKLVFSPEAVEHIPLTTNSRVWTWAGTVPPKTDEPLSAEQSVNMAMDAVANLLKHMTTLKGRRDLVGFVLGQQLRHEYGLGEGHGHEVVPLQDDLADTRAGIEGYPEVDAHLDLEAIRESAPPKQREAIDIYLERARTGRTVEELARERGLSPVNVRNNLSALAKKHRP